MQFHEDLVLAEDMAFMMEAYPHGKRFSFIPDALYNYRWARKGSVTNSRLERKDKLPHHLKTIEHITAYWQRQGWIDLYWEDYVPWFFNFVLSDITLEEPELARGHLQYLVRLTKTFQLGEYLEKLSPRLSECFTEIAQTVTGEHFDADEISQ